MPYHFVQVSGQGGGNFFEGREMTELERCERIRKEARHINHHGVVCNECTQKYQMKNPSESNEVVLSPKMENFQLILTKTEIVVVAETSPDKKFE